MERKQPKHRPGWLPKAIVISKATIVSGAGRGRRIGIPTLNIELSSAPKELTQGIYACWIILDGTRYKGAMHFGPRPVFKDSETLEVHVIDEAIAETPKTTDVEIVARIRGVENFPSVEALIEAIQSDIDASRAILSAP